MSVLEESRYDRQERISWWDQSRLRSSKVLVVGAGALGNELVKNLVLLGIGEVDVIDMDIIEHTNLARCVFFRAGDEGKPKAQALAEAAQALNPDVKVSYFVDPVQALGSGFLRKYDVVLGGLDNREARLWVNRVCRRLGIFWIDGAIEGLHGIVQCFGSQGACYECTLTEVDWKILSHRRSCALLGVQEMIEGKTPTNATTAGIVAALQAQEAVKHLVGKEDLLALVGKQWTLLGESMTSFTSFIDEDPNCMAHEDVVTIDFEFRDAVTLRDVVSRTGFGSDTILDLSEDFLTVKPCDACKTGGVTGLRTMLKAGVGTCATCGSALETETRTSLTSDDAVLDLPIQELGWSRCEAVSLRSSDGTSTALVWRHDESA